MTKRQEKANIQNEESYSMLSNAEGPKPDDFESYDRILYKW